MYSGQHFSDSDSLASHGLSDGTPTSPTNPESRLIAKPKKRGQRLYDQPEDVDNSLNSYPVYPEGDKTDAPKQAYHSSNGNVRATPAESAFDEEENTTDKDRAIAKMRASGDAIRSIASSVKNDISFFWSVYRIEQSYSYDDLRIQYVNRFMAQEALKLLGAVAGVVLGSLCIAGVLCFPMHLVLGALITSIAALYAGYKIYQHVQGYMQDDERRYTPVY